MEHHRSASWAEREYLHMYNLVSSKSAELCNCMANPEGFMVYDYTDMSRTNHQRNTSAIALRYVNRVDET